MNPKILDVSQLAEIGRRFHAENRRIIATNGCFDLLHIGHVRYLQAARELGDALVVGVNGDASVRALKGPTRPLNSAVDRAEILAALECVDFVSVFPEVRATNFLRSARPALYVKGGDYEPETLDADERSLLHGIGAEIKIIPYEPGYSTSTLIERMSGG